MKFSNKPSKLSWLLVLAAAVTAACGGSSEPAQQIQQPLAGIWRAVLSSPGGELPFSLRIDSAAGELSAIIENGEEEVPFSAVERNGSRVVFHFEWYDSEITADLSADGSSLVGTWRKTIPDGNSTLPFRAHRGDLHRFESAPAAVDESGRLASVNGHWAVEFSDDDGSEVARGEFLQQGQSVTGTFLTPTGDYRFLDGSFENGLLRLSTFDGAHAFLFQAQASEEGTLEGDFWSRDSYHATWTAQQVDQDEEILPDEWTAVGLTNDEGRFNFSFPGLDGETLSLDDPRFAGKAVLVNIFGTWCPNCNDEAPLLAEWHRRYRDRGLEIVGLAYEFSGDPERDMTLLERFGKRYGIEYPLLLAGISDKKAAAETLPDLTAVLSYPTTLFIGRDGKVRKIHSGFSGPGTGGHYDELVAELEGVIETLLEEPV